MKYPLPAIVKVQTEWGPDAAGATSDDSPQGDAGGARRRPRLRFVGSSAAVPVPMLSRTPWPGTDGNQSCGCGDCGAGDEDTPDLFSMRGDEREGYSWTTLPSMPPATVTTWPVFSSDS